MGGAALMGIMFIGQSSRAILDLAQGIFRDADRTTHTLALHEAGHAVMVAVYPFVIGAILGALVAGALQVGWPPVFRWPQFDLTRPFSGGSISQMMSPRAVFGRVVMATAKVVFVGTVAMVVLQREYHHFLANPVLDPKPLAIRLGSATARLALQAGLALALLATYDYLSQRFKLAAKMRMTPSEFKREHKEQEGDPGIKRRRRQRMRELSKRRLAIAVKTADVVLVNPTEYAVALRYRSNENRAPRVVAKGRGEVAERIRELARKAGIPIVAEPPLTRLIHKLVPEGKEIPSTLYKAVAEILAYVYRLRHRHL